MEIDVRRIPADSQDALTLVGLMVDGLTAEYGPQDDRYAPSATPEDFSPPGGCFVAVYRDGRAVAGGGIKRLDASTGEVKRMYVVEDARGQGLARRLLGALEDAARDLGYERLRLDTSDRQPHALALYRSAGYRSIPDYNANDYATYWGEKELR